MFLFQLKNSKQFLTLWEHIFWKAQDSDVGFLNFLWWENWPEVKTTVIVYVCILKKNLNFYQSVHILKETPCAQGHRFIWSQERALNWFKRSRIKFKPFSFSSFHWDASDLFSKCSFNFFEQRIYTIYCLHTWTEVLQSQCVVPPQWPHWVWTSAPPSAHPAAAWAASSAPPVTDAPSQTAAPAPVENDQ